MSTKKTNTDNNSETSIEPGDLSKVLKEYRSDANLGLEQVAEALCLPASSVTALESEDFDKLPEAPYVRGYLRTYSRLAEKDPSRAIKIYEELRGADVSNDIIHNYVTNTSRNEAGAPILSESRVRLGMLALLVAVLGLLTMTPGVKNRAKDTWNNFSSKEASQSHSLPGESLTDTPGGLAGNIPGNLPIAEKTPSSTEAETAQNETTPPEEETTEPAETQSSEPAPEDTSAQQSTTEKIAEKAPSTEEATTSTNSSPQQPDTPPESTGNTQTQENPDSATTTTPEESEVVIEGDTNLKLTFSDEVWLRIQDENKKTIFEALNPPGTEKTLKLSRPMKLTVGNAPGLTLYVNGEKMDIESFTKGSVARFSIE